MQTDYRMMKAIRQPDIDAAQATGANRNRPRGEHSAVWAIDRIGRRSSRRYVPYATAGAIAVIVGFAAS